jgi:hypothetical protein
LPLAHWLLFVQRHAVWLVLTAPMEQVYVVAVGSRTAQFALSRFVVPPLQLVALPQPALFALAPVVT